MMKHIVTWIVDSFFAFAALVCVALFWPVPWLLFGLLVLLAALQLFPKPKKAEVLTFLFVALWGPLAEAFGIVFGAWQYALPNMLILPVWLFPLWGLAGIYIMRTQTYFSSTKSMKSARMKLVAKSKSKPKKRSYKAKK